MATRSCPTCGAQYVATVRRCIDCDVVLVDEVVDDGSESPAVSSGEPVGSGDQIGYELDGWGNQLKVTLDGMLLRAGIGRVWEAGALVVAAGDEERVDDLIATLEGGDLAELADDTPRVALEIEDLDADGQAELDARLIAESLSHAWDDAAALVVAEADEERVLEIIGEVIDAHGDGTEEDGLMAQQALSALYVAVDRLIKHPHDSKLATAYVTAADGLDGVGVPYGFAGSDWDDLLAEADALASSVGSFATHPEPEGDDPAGAEADDEHDPGEVDEGEWDDGGPVDADDAAETGRDDDDPEDGDDGKDEEGDGDDDPDAVDDATDAASPVAREDVDRDAARALRARLVDLV